MCSSQNQTIQTGSYAYASLVPRTRPAFHTASDGKLGGAWVRGYAYAKEDDKVAPVEKPCHLPQKEITS